MPRIGTPKVDQLVEMRLRFEGKLIRFGTRGNVYNSVGICKNVQTWGEQYPHYLEGNPNHASRDYLVFDFVPLHNTGNNYWLRPDEMEVWGEDGT